MAKKAGKNPSKGSKLMIKKNTHSSPNVDDDDDPPVFSTFLMGQKKELPGLKKRKLKFWKKRK